MFIRLALLGLAFASAGAAGEYAVLHTGLRIAVERHETVGASVRLFTSDGGSMELPAALIARFEPDGKPPPQVKTPDRPEPEPDLNAIVESMAADLDVHPALIHSVIAAESAYDPNAVSPKGAVGLMQLMPHTAHDLQVTDRTNPNENVRGGTTYLRQLLDRYKGSEDSLLRALAAYNAGPGKVDDHNGLPPYNETRLFVRRVIEGFLRLTDPKQD